MGWPAPAALAQDYPSRAIKIIVATAAGGSADLVPRILGQRITEKTGQPVVVENRVGGNGALAGSEVLAAPRDGYTLLLGHHAPIAILPHITNLKFDPPKDFVPVVHALTVPNMLVVHPAVPAKTLPELVAYVKANPGKLSYASQGVASTGHIAMEMLKQRTGIDLIHVPYRGSMPAQQDVIAGQIPISFDNVQNAAEPVKAGRMRAIGVASLQRVGTIPDVPTLAEQGLTDFETSAWFGLFAPAGTPPAVIAWLNAEANRALGDPEVRNRFLVLGAAVPLGTPQQFGSFVAAEYQKWGDVVRRAGIRVD